MANEAKSQLEILEDQILGLILPSGKDVITVYPIEAGVGKTTTMVRGIKRLLRTNPSEKVLIVTKYVSEVKRLRDEFNGHALAIYSSNNCDDDERILQSSVVIITHARYIELCKKENEQRWCRYATGRNLLIIDEELQIVKVSTISYETYCMIRNSVREIDARLVLECDRVFDALLPELIECRKRHCDTTYVPKKVSKNTEKDLGRIIDVISRKVNDYTFWGMLKNMHDDDDKDNYYALSYDELYNAIRRLIAVLNSNFCISNKMGIHTCDSPKFRLLGNNILLDASASMLPVYTRSKLFEFRTMERIVDHSDWTLRVCKINSSRRAKNADGTMFRAAARMIKKISDDPEKKLLVISDKMDVGNSKEKGKFQNIWPDLSKRENVGFINFEAMRGRNDWTDHDNCFIIHTHFRPSAYYPLCLKYYIPDIELDELDLRMNWTGEGKRLHFGYVNNILLDEFRENDVAASTYQAVKRINRGNDKKADVYFVTNDLNIIKILKDNMIGLRLETFTLPVPKVAKRKRWKYSRKNASPVRTRLKKLLRDLANGKYVEYECDDAKGQYTKKWCAEKIGYHGKHLYRHLRDLAPYIEKLGLEVTHHRIIVRKYNL